MAQNHRNIILAGLGAVVVAGLLYTTLRPEPIPVDLHTVALQEFEITVDVDGETRVAELYEVAAPISGVALRAPVEVGDAVTAGETVVAQVEPAASGLLDTRSRLQAEAQVREAEASLHVAETDRTKGAEDLAYAQSQYDRVSQLVDRDVASITQLEGAHQRLAVAQAALEAAEARIAQARSGLDRARAALVDTTTEPGSEVCCVPILSPADGVVLDIDTESARPVLVGARLLTIGDPRNLEIVADVLSSDAVRLPENADAYVERWGGPQLTARLLRVEPAGRTKVSALGIEEQRVDAIFELTSPPDMRKALGHGFAVYLRIVEYRQEDVLVVPLSATFRSGDDWAVFRASGDRAERVPVELGRRNGRYALVVSGLSPGDRVIEHPSEALEDGALIVPRTTYGGE
ncbi:efflux RND transporter periplasmic adaptor subunit [Ovoidimarina sediminis]|uniref:efflux RND transporter periplasmic adaptor subunit n=1 Tax=Ovoidimarina sediminis TaxID=3079856 RepID=UPI0029147779|nr:HlyD family efflux transporter periplasmic adaptor subunit [Rhodophyticola sp. MJ-SS7]MDU8943743.1 HlyD family efflux transporter periplasmic adaptor subunit [Rhodophyticola sp. MJ-SS7]